MTRAAPLCSNRLSVKPWQIIDENLRAAMQFFSLSNDAGETRSFPGISVVCSGINFSVFNAALLTAPVPGVHGDLDRRITVGGVYFGARGLRWSFWLCEDQLDRLTRVRLKGIFANRGLHPLVDPPGMIAESLNPASRALPALEYRRVSDELTRLAFCHVTSVAFELPFSVSRDIYDSERAWQGGMVGWVGYRNSEPVATAATQVAAGAIGIYSVATLPQCRNAGCAEAAVRHAVEQARAATGIERTVLQSTRAGLRLYERMGYRTVTRFAVYTV